MDKKTVTTISYLSRLSIDNEKEEKIVQDLDNIIELDIKSKYREENKPINSRENLQDNDVFYLQQPYPSWSLNASWVWEAPVAFPAGAGTTEQQADIAVWDEAQSKWYYLDASENRFNWDASSLVWVAA